MRRLGLILIVLIGFVLLVGCGQDEAAPEVEAPVDNEQVDEVREPVILDADVPERDPFSAGSGSSNWDTEGSTVRRQGRNPFAVADGSSDWRTQRGSVNTSGRDPFVQGSYEPYEPDEPDEPNEPDEPDDPDDPDVGPAPGEVNVQLTTLDRCWLDVFVDGDRVLRTNVPRGETLEWAGSVILLEQVGREFGVAVTVNGQDLGRLGTLVQRLEDGPIVEGGVRISLEQRYAGGVLVGLEFAVVAN